MGNPIYFRHAHVDKPFQSTAGLTWFITSEGFVFQANGNSLVVKDLSSVDSKEIALKLGVDPKEVFKAKLNIISLLNRYNHPFPIPEDVRSFWNHMSFEERLEAIAIMPPQVNRLKEEGIRRGWLTEEEDARKLSIGQRAEIIADLILSEFRFVKVNLTGRPTGEYELYVVDGNILRDADDVIRTCVNSIAGWLATDSLVREVKSRLFSRSIHIDGSRVNPTEYLPVKNGILSLKHFELVPQCDCYFTYKVPVEVDPSFLDMLKEGQVTEDHFSSSIIYKIREHYDDENWSYLKDALGSILIPFPLRLIAFIVGSQATGKTLLSEAIKACLGSGIASVSLKDIQNDPFALQAVIGARAVVTTETVYNIKEVEVLKRLVGGDTLSINRKHKPRVELRENTLKLICLGNRLPPVDIRDDALLDRLTIITAENPIPEEERDPTLLKKVKEEEERRRTLEFLLYCAWELRQRGYRVRRLEQEKIIELVDEASDPIAWYIKECVVEDPDVRTERRDMYSHYIEMCKRYGREPVSRNKFYMLARKRYPEVAIRGKRYFKGVRPKIAAELELEL